ncbi:MAG: hypothetical protein Q7S03_03700 [bacterium]|nr:hypothetical protein [bacterium]
MTNKLLKIILGAVCFLVLGNLLFLDFVWFKPKPENTEIKRAVSVELAQKDQKAADNSLVCGQDCQEKIQAEVQNAISALPTSAPGTRTVYITGTQSSAQTSNVIYFPIGSSGVTSNLTWADIPSTDFYFNLADYPKLKNVTWEVSLRSFEGASNVYARIYDVTNSRAVDGSELTTTSEFSVLLRSGNLTIWQGNNLYRIQAKTSSGHPVYLDAPRLKVVSQ